MHESKTGQSGSAHRPDPAVCAAEESAPPNIAGAPEHFRAIVESSDDAIISKTLDGRITSWNPGATRMFGYSEQDMLHQPMLKLFPPERVAEEDFILDKIRHGEKVDHYETERLHRDGRRIHVSVSVSPVRDATGRIIGASKIARDITAQKDANARFRLTASVFSHTSEGIVIVDPHGRIVDVNEAFCRITGFERPQIIGRTPDMFASSRQGPAEFEIILNALAQTGHWQGEAWSRRQDGESFASLVKISAVRNEQGQTQNYVVLVSDVTRLRRQQETLEHLAHFDALTDLPNRLLLSDRLVQAINASRRSDDWVAVLYLDLDGFKAVNDRLGHDAGDELLVLLARRVSSQLRETDTLARMGGDEFVAVLVGLRNHNECVQLVDRVLRVCTEPFFVKGESVQVSASIGVALYPQNNVDAEQLIRHADRAMYEAKQAGKNRYHLFDPDLHKRARSRSEQLEDIARGLRRGEFELFYQPKVNMRSGQVIGVEALIRWRHPQRGLLSPAAFLPQTEGHQLAAELDRWVLDQALNRMAVWRAQGLDALTVSVNLNGRNLQQRGFAEALAATLASHPDAPPERLELELLETSALDDINDVAVVMQDCHRLGVRFAVDDFGTGYSSLVYLKRLPAETIKIDCSFVRDMLTDRDDRAIVQGIVGLAHAFGRELIAEGVESVAHGCALLAMGCEQGQGFGIAQPMPAEDLAAWIAGWQPPTEWTAAPAAK